MLSSWHRKVGGSYLLDGDVVDEDLPQLCLTIFEEELEPFARNG